MGELEAVAAERAQVRIARFRAWLDTVRAELALTEDEEEGVVAPRPPPPPP